MNCPYCSKHINGMTGLQELLAFKKHLPKCKKNPANLPLSDGRKTVIVQSQPTTRDALRIRAASGQ